MTRHRFSPALPRTPAFTAGDGLIVLGLIAFLYIGARLGMGSPKSIAGPQINLAPRALPWYAALSVGRMAAAYVLSLGFSLAYGYAAARNRTARSVLMPLLDVLQSVPILSFLPIVLLGLSAFLPQSLAAELAAIVLIFTSQAWNMTFSFYQSVSTIPMELREATAVFRLDSWLRFRTLELPFAAIGLIWNSMMSWSGGWFFLMAAEIFHVGSRDFRLPGLGSYLQTAASAGDIRAVIYGLAMLIVVIVVLDQCVWRPILAWSDRFRVESVEGEEAPSSWFLDLMERSALMRWLRLGAWPRLTERLDGLLRRPADAFVGPLESETEARPAFATRAIGGFLTLVAAYAAYRALGLLSSLPVAAWGKIAVALAATFGRVCLALLIALLWTIPVGVAIGTNRRLANLLQPAVQVVSAIPATALFPVLLLGLLKLPYGLNVAAVVLMLMGTQWYLLFNVIAGAAAIPQDLKMTTDMLRLSRIDRWKTLVMPAVFPYVVTGAITASGGAWNASIVAEQVEFGGVVHQTTGVGALIAQATAADDSVMLLAATLAMVLAVVLLNRSVWRALYRRAEERYRLE